MTPDALLLTVAFPLIMAAIILVAFMQILRLLHGWMMHATLRRALSSQQPVALAMVERLDGARRETSDDRNGLVLVAIGLAIAGFGLIQGGEANIRITLGAALFPLFVGAALLIRHWMAGRDGACNGTGSEAETAVGG